MCLTGHASDDEEAYPCLKQYAADGDDWLFSHVPTSRHAKAQKSGSQAAQPTAPAASSAAATAPAGPRLRQLRSSVNAAPSSESGRFSYRFCYVYHVPHVLNGCSHSAVVSCLVLWWCYGFVHASKDDETM